MARNVKDYERRVFKVLEESIKEAENRDRIIHKERDVFLDEDNYSFIEKMKWVKLPNIEKVAIVNYQDDWFVCSLNNKRYSGELVKETESWCGDALTVALISSHRMPIASNTTEIQIVDSVLAVEEDKYQVKELKELFSPQTSYLLSDTFDISYQEDLIRLICLLEIDEKKYLTEKTRGFLVELLFLESSRSVAQLIVNICHTHDSKLIFLQLYRMMEYLFMIHKAIEMGKKYDIDKKVIVEMLCDDHAFRQAEEQHVVELISGYASTDSKDKYIDYLKNNNLTSEQVENCDEALAKYIYKRRCQIAHFKYRQEEIPDEAVLSESNERLAELVKTMYIKLNNDIVTVNDHFETWSEVCYESIE